jgi:ATPase subunit of ABC transporter with duplicated ATPase domains
MNEELNRSSASIRDQLSAGDGHGLEQLSDLAKRIATDRSLFDKALLLRARFAQSPSAELTDELKREALALLADVIADCEASSDSEDARRNRAALAEIREHYCQRPPERSVVFECEGLSKRYRKGDFRLEDVTLRLRLGEITGLVGPNANGKTTLLRMVAGELRQTSGTLSFPLVEPWLGRLNWARVKEQLAYVPQELPQWFGSLRDPSL